MRAHREVGRLWAQLRFAPRETLARLLARDSATDEDRADLARLARLMASGAPAPAASPRATLLIASFLPLPYCLKIEGFLGLAMRERGYRVVALANASTLPLVRAYHGRVFGFECALLEEHLDFSRERVRRDRLAAALPDTADVAALKRLRYRGAMTGLHALATLSSQWPDGRLRLDTDARARLASLLRRSMALTDAATAALAALRPDLVLSVEKGFVGTSELFYAALEAGLDYVQWVGCHQPNSIMLKRYAWDNYRDHPFSLSRDSWNDVARLPWRERYREHVVEEFTAGYRDGNWFRYKALSTDQRQAERDELQDALRLDPTRKTAIIYSHILNDANLFYGEDLFESGFEEWLVETVRAAAANPRVNWVLKLHPANRIRNARVGSTGEYGELLALRQAVGTVPEFLRVVRPEERVSPLSFFRITDWGITVRGTVGLELPCFGAPVLTAGTGRYANRGFTVDSASREEYLARVSRIDETPALTEEQIRTAIRYAFFAFKRRPASYDAIFEDVYGPAAQSRRHRDLAVKAERLAEVLSHPQLAAMAGFLDARGQRDFLASPEADEEPVP